MPRGYKSDGTKLGFQTGHRLSVGKNLGNKYAVGNKLTKEHVESIRRANIGKVVSNETRKKMSLTKTGASNPMWKGDKVGYIALHEWVKNRSPKSGLCERCRKNKPYDLANISQEYKRDIRDWEWLCRRCHMLSDGRMSNLKQFCGEVS